MSAHSLRFVYGAVLCLCLQSTAIYSAEIRAGDSVITRSAAPVMSGQDLKGHIPAGTRLIARKVEGPWVAVDWSRNGERISGWIRSSDLTGEDAGSAHEAAARNDYPKSKQLANFKAYPQQSGNTCSAAAARNVLGHVTGRAPLEWLLFYEIVAEDHKGLAHLEDKLKRLGVYNPAALSAFGGTAVGIKAVIDKRLPDELKCDYREVPALEDRIRLIVHSINRGWPVIVPVVSASLHHWITITGYDRDARQFSTASFGPLSFERFDTLNSWRTMPGGILGKAFQLANEERMGRRVLVYVTKDEGATDS
jgi:hypothetical protein